MGLLVYNGVSQFSADYTCSRHAGSSVVDYICGRSLPTSFTICDLTLERYSDHRVLCCTLPIPSLVDLNAAPAVCQFRSEYSWVTSDLRGVAGASHSRWAEHTNTVEFASLLHGIVSNQERSVDEKLGLLE